MIADTLNARDIDPRAYLDQATAESDEPLLFLPT